MPVLLTKEHMFRVVFHRVLVAWGWLGESTAGLVSSRTPHQAVMRILGEWGLN